MKDTTVIPKAAFAICYILSFYGCAKKAEDYSGPANSFKRYPIEHFHITYEISGDGRGIEEVYVSDYGKFEAEQSKTEIFAQQGVMSEDRSLVTRIADIYEIDNQRKEYIHNHVNALDSVFHLGGKDIPSPAQYMETQMQSGFLRNVGQETIDGKLTTKWQQPDGNLTMWTWNGILFRKTVHADEGGGGITMMLKTFDSSWVVDTTKFMIPKGYTERVPNQEEMNAPQPN